MWCVVLESPWRVVLFFFKQKTAYEMRISDWSSDVCSSDLQGLFALRGRERRHPVDPSIPLPLAGGVRGGHGRSTLGNKPSPGPSRKRAIGRASCRERVCQYV